MFVRVEPDNAYFIDICTHGHQGEKYVFAKQELLAIWKRNWPETLERYSIKGMRIETITDEEIAILRRGGCNALAGVDGQSYASMGGRPTAGTNIKHTMKADRVMQAVRECEIRCQIQKKLLSSKYQPPFNFDFKLEIRVDRFVVIQFPEKIIIGELPF